MAGKKFHIEVRKTGESHGIVFGYAIICTEGGEPYYDKQGDHIPEDAMVEAADEFMLSARVSAERHAREADGTPVQKGTVVFAYPMTTDIAKALGISTERTGLLIGVKPDPATLAKYQSGELTGFSIGGTRIIDELVEE